MMAGTDGQGDLHGLFVRIRAGFCSRAYRDFERHRAGLPLRRQVMQRTKQQQREPSDIALVEGGHRVRRRHLT